MRADGLEPDRQQVVDGHDTGWLRPLVVAESLNGLDAAPVEILGESLDQHPAESAAGELPRLL